MSDEVQQKKNHELSELMKRMSDNQMSRRQFVVRAAALGFGVTTIGAALAACGSADHHDHGCGWGHDHHGSRRDDDHGCGWGHDHHGSRRDDHHGSREYQGCHPQRNGAGGDASGHHRRKSARKTQA